jgi:hypothetical protein
MIGAVISMIQPLHVGNALRLFIQPPAGAVRWKVLRKGSGSFSGHDDPSAIVAYEGDDHVTVDTAFLQNEVMAFYRPFYTADGATWTPGPVASGTPAATYEEFSTDVMTLLRERLEAGLLVEIQRGNLVNELGYVQVYTAAPSLERDLRMPLVTLHLESEEPGERGIGEYIGGDGFDGLDDEWLESEGWLANVRVAVIGWSLNGDERIELRKAIRRVVVANLPVFDASGLSLVNLSQQDMDAINGEYPAPIYQVMNTFTCLAPVRVGGRESSIREIISARSNND